MSNSIEQGRQEFNRHWQKCYPGCKDKDLRLMDMRNRAQHGDAYCQQEVRKMDRATLAIESGRGRTAEMEAHANGVAASRIDQFGDHVTLGANRDLEKFARTGKLRHLAGAGGRVFCGAGFAMAEEAAAGVLVAKAGLSAAIGGGLASVWTFGRAAAGHP